MRVAALLWCAFFLAGCATVNYIASEYGTGFHDGTVTRPDGSTFWVWQHKTRRKVLISVDPAQAAGMGVISGLTFGGVSGAVPQPIFEDVAERWFDQTGRAECKTTKGYPLENVYFEFEYECVPARPPPPRRR